MALRQRTLALLATLVVMGGLLAGCAGNSGDHPVELAMAPLHTLPMSIQEAPRAYREAYQFAVANPDALADVPCTCGCDQFGHKSNYDCFVAGTQPDGTVILDFHALGCQICIDIAQDVMRDMRQGYGRTAGPS